MTQVKAAPPPGPYEVLVVGKTMREGYSQPFGIVECASIGPEGANMLAGVFGDQRGGEEVARATAQLFAAAPLMRDALKIAVDFVERDVIRVRPSEREEFLRGLEAWHSALAAAELP